MASELLKYLSANLNTEVKDGELYYKNIPVKAEGLNYMQNLEGWLDIFKKEIYSNTEVRWFEVLGTLYHSLLTHTNFYADEIVFFQSQRTEIPELAEYEYETERKYKLNQLNLLEIIVKKEITINKKAINFIIKENNIREKQESSNKSTFDIAKKIIFNGNQDTIIFLFEQLMKSKFILLNSDKTFPSDQKHLEYFLENNFLYKKNNNNLPIKNIDVTLSKLRNLQINKGQKAKQEIIDLLNGVLQGLNDILNEIK